MAASFRSHCLIVLGIATLLAGANPVRAARSTDPATRIWVTDQDATSLAADQGLLYVGGYFHVIAPATGGGAVVDLKRGDLAAPAAQVDGLVFAAVPDGGGGWFIGGDFKSVGGKQRFNLAHIDRNGSVSDWIGDAGGAVSCLVLSSGRLFVGGAFSFVGGAARTGVAALDPKTGKALAWDAHVEGQVLAIACQGNTVYLGGRFLAAGGQSRAHLAAVNTSDGSLLPWDPGASGEVYALAQASGMVLVGGETMTIGRAPRTGLAAVDARTGAVLPWNPPLSATGAASFARTVAVHGSTVYFAGFFDHVGDVAIRYVASVDLRTGAPIHSWHPELDADVWGIGVHGDAVYLAGDFRYFADPIADQRIPRSFACAVDPNDGRLLPWDPEATNSARAIAVQGSSAYVGGLFRGIGGRARPGIAAIEAATGEIHDWNPNYGYFPQPGVDVLAAGNGRVYAGGGYWLGGLTYFVWGFEPPGRNPSWNVYGPRGSVSALALQGNTLYFGGLFDRVNGVSTIPDERRGLAAVDATTARLLLWNPAPYRDSRLPPTIDALAVHGSNVYVGGFFSELGGAPRSLLGAVDAVTGNSTNWAPAPGNWGKALVVTDDRVFVGMPRKVAALDASTGAELWANNAVGSVDALVMSNGLLIAAGSFVAINGENRRGLAALDPATGTVTPWNPDLNRPTNALAVVGDKLFGVSGRGVYSLPLPVKTTARSLAVRPAPARPTSVTRLSEIQSGGAQLSLSVPESGPVSVGVFDLQGRRVATVLDHTWLEAGAHEQAIRTADWPRGLYFVRVDLAGRTETHRIAVIR